MSFDFIAASYGRCLLPIMRIRQPLRATVFCAIDTASVRGGDSVDFSDAFQAFHLPK